MKDKVSLGIAALAVIAFVGSANAVPTITFTATSGSSVTIGDNLAGDTDPTVGTIDWKGTVGGWTVNVFEGTSYGAGDAMDTTFKATSSSTVLLAPLTLTFTETGVNLTGPISASIGGTTSTQAGNVPSGTVRYEVSNGGLIYDSGLLAGVLPHDTHFGASGSGPAGLISQLTQTIIITDGSKGQITSGDAIVSANAVPDGSSTLALLGFCIAGIEGIRRKIAK